MLQSGRKPGILRQLYEPRKLLKNAGNYWRIMWNLREKLKQTTWVSRVQKYSQDTFAAREGCSAPDECSPKLPLLQLLFAVKTYGKVSLRLLKNLKQTLENFFSPILWPPSALSSSSTWIPCSAFCSSLRRELMSKAELIWLTISADTCDERVYVSGGSV